MYANKGDVYGPAVIGEAPTFWFGAGFAIKATAAKTMTAAAPTAIKAGTGRLIEGSLQTEGPR